VKEPKRREKLPGLLELDPKAETAEQQGNRKVARSLSLQNMMKKPMKYTSSFLSYLPLFAENLF
jgi:hypothetical protein